MKTPKIIVTDNRELYQVKKAWHDDSIDEVSAQGIFSTLMLAMVDQYGLEQTGKIIFQVYTGREL